MVTEGVYRRAPCVWACTTGMAVPARTGRARLCEG